MGTTLLIAFKDDHKVVIEHVGDSRAYVIRKGQIEQVTEDHTFVFQWSKEGLITPEEARTHNPRHGLTAALGVRGRSGHSDSAVAGEYLFTDVLGRSYGNC